MRRSLDPCLNGWTTCCCVFLVSVIDLMAAHLLSVLHNCGCLLSLSTQSLSVQYVLFIDNFVINVDVFIHCVLGKIVLHAYSLCREARYHCLLVLQGPNFTVVKSCHMRLVSQSYSSGFLCLRASSDGRLLILLICIVTYPVKSLCSSQTCIVFVSFNSTEIWNHVGW